MANEKEHLDMAKWILERNLAWIAAAEVKVGVIIAIDTGMLGGLAAAFSGLKVSERSECIYLWTLSAAGPIAIAIFCAAMSILPRVNGPSHSFLFFGRIAQLNKAEYSNKFREASGGEFLDDLIGQIHRNAEIAVSKFTWVRRSMWWSFFSILPWIASIFLLIKR